MGTTVQKLFRYPVKSMAGESLDSVTLGPKGLPGDRAWALRDEERGGIKGGKRFAQLMACSARYVDAPRADGTSSPAKITLPDGSIWDTDDAATVQAVSALIDHPVSLWPLLPEDALDHYRRVAPESSDIQQELRRVFARMPDEPLPDLSAFPSELMEFESPPGTYFDAFPLLLTTTTTLQTLSNRAPESNWDVRRFRPNLLFETTEAGDFPEDQWIGRELAIGSARLKVELACPRCIMTTHGFGDLPKDPSIMRTMVREHDGNLGVYATVARSGTVATGDVVELM
ncbi:MAG: MOSC domain-containing protein [Pseudomonadales bacterium]|jgi:hypothetical protein|nr:MOSC domain-containing protein [Pseudomonadales bacterium]MDP6470713.1 MOSC domain-containing protein [Pseudomonadales bacterium]MDP6828335.1 MOSC domain-containing protein [Pseudomonadales bacterium]MDP6972115.1 MOSC domain-containing protein [Pseudomonadales bacterium]|tara:strand:+ start:2603 stop:3460 length:858 start_codon:yes stop_codon:yes gene_type:complete